ncbi:hypothetical protein [Endozoicomonas sp. GU-1]|uniref:hypothetical protein n=1 Tax=Endozoicomonas sp. GU-1 TaxID=3009078 RepID=UPI0022B5016E|nr:hypothetical protein [Endozoicomonas sp. GU-1]WBA81409.1 hypothetical protein O2T12_24555 [Endozoicomonas sp. GU-1]WBA84357.1 hypothetical protein O3276_13720 [Endozoicomonas sp. GU-1]
MEKIVDKRLGDKGSLLDRRGVNNWLNIDQLFFSLSQYHSINPDRSGDKRELQ